MPIQQCRRMHTVGKSWSQNGFAPTIAKITESKRVLFDSTIYSAKKERGMAVVRKHLLRSAARSQWQSLPATMISKFGATASRPVHSVTSRIVSREFIG